MSADHFRRLDERVYVSPQLEPEDFAAANALGVRLVINNRPDGEAADQIPTAEAERLAHAAGLDYRHIPVVSGGLTREAVDGFAQALDASEGLVLAYCRSGTRSCHLWAIAAARRTPVDRVIEIAGRAGYDIAGARPLLERIAADAAQPVTSQK